MKNGYRQNGVFRASIASGREFSRPSFIHPPSVSSPPAPAGWSARFKSCLSLLLLAFTASPLVGLAEDSFPPFMVEASITSKYFWPNPTNASTIREEVSQHDVTFYSSNGWWQVEVNNLDARPSHATSQNSMKIPDGVREFMLIVGSTNGGMTLAEAYPITFPTTGDSKRLLAWLSFCPHPQLPLIDGQKMHRFLYVPRGGIALEMLNHPQNEGYFNARYLQPGAIFLSELNVTNNGVSVDMTYDKSGNPELEVKRLSAPWDKGFLGFRFAVLETTNVNGMAFPLRTMIKHLYPKWDMKNPADLYLAGQLELVVKRISFAETDLSNRKLSPSELLAYDYRPPNLPKETSVGYMVTNDLWPPLSDPSIQSSARRIRRNADPYRAPEKVDKDLNSDSNRWPDRNSSRINSPSR
jgi:hypothetical protein